MMPTEICEQAVQMEYHWGLNPEYRGTQSYDNFSMENKLQCWYQGAQLSIYFCNVSQL